MWGCGSNHRTIPPGNVDIDMDIVRLTSGKYFFVSSSWEPTLDVPNDLWKMAIHVEGGPLTRNIEGVMPSPSCCFQSHFFVVLVVRFASFCQLFSTTIMSN